MALFSLCLRYARGLARVPAGALLALAFALAAAPAAAQDAAVQPDGPISAEADADADRALEGRLEDIFSAMAPLQGVDPSVEGGVITLEGEVANGAAATRALGIAARMEGAVAVEDALERTLAVEDNVAPAVQELRSAAGDAARAAPLYGLAFAVFALIVFLAFFLAAQRWLWRRIAPNSFIASLFAQVIRIIGVIAALVTSLSLVGATALLGTLLGGAGVAGIAIGFAVRDTLENYIASVLLSLRQPFSKGDHVVIDSHEGAVMSLTTRATNLMTPDGNNLRIPNAQVFKAVILNYTVNPERQFSFRQNVDASDDPAAAMQEGLKAVSALEFVLREPAPAARIASLADGAAELEFSAWIDQRETGFDRGRSLAIRAAAQALSEAGFGLPAPVHKVELQQASEAPPRPAVPEATDRAVLDPAPDLPIETLAKSARGDPNEGEDLLEPAAR